MVRAVLVAGDESRFLRETEKLKRHLSDSCGLADVRLLDSGEMARDEFRAVLGDELARFPEEALLLVYSGHGSRAIWSLGPYGVRYDELVDLLLRRRGPTLIVNACCHSGGILKQLEAKGADPGRYALIASAPDPHVSYTGTIGRIVGSWSRRQPYVPVQGTFPAEYGGVIFDWETIITETMEPDENGVMRRIMRVRFKEKSWWWQRSWNRFMIAYRRRFPKIEPSDVFREFRWGAELDALFFPPA